MLIVKNVEILVKVENKIPQFFHTYIFPITGFIDKFSSEEKPLEDNLTL